ncbi:MAG: AAA family ATPase, partial [Planctomycetota bacterium]|nr:AAA family ATPase [Planctomycetota bacterium]
MAMARIGAPEPNPKLLALRKNLETVILGKSECIEILAVALASVGSGLMEEVPGLGNTTLAKALAKSIDAGFCRIQFTPVLLPAESLRRSVYYPDNRTFNFRRVAIFRKVLLAEEINRASPR